MSRAHTLTQSSSFKTQRCRDRAIGLQSDDQWGFSIQCRKFILYTSNSALNPRRGHRVHARESVRADRCVRLPAHASLSTATAAAIMAVCGAAAAAAAAGGGRRWYFSREQLARSPSRRAGIDPDKELSYRQQAANLLQDMGQRLNVYPFRG